MSKVKYDISKVHEGEVFKSFNELYYVLTGKKISGGYGKKTAEKYIDTLLEYADEKSKYAIRITKIYAEDERPQLKDGRGKSPKIKDGRGKSPKKRMNVVGQRFGKLVVLEDAEDNIDKNNTHHRFEKCLCDCGEICYISLYNLTGGLTKSCGCLRRHNTGRPRHTNPLLSKIIRSNMTPEEAIEALSKYVEENNN